MAPGSDHDTLALAVAVGPIMVHKGKPDPESHLDVIRITIADGAEKELRFVRARWFRGEQIACHGIGASS